VFDHEVRYSNGFADTFLRNLAIPLTNNLLPSESAVELFEDYPHHNSRALERRLAAANLRIRDNMSSQLNSAMSGLFRFHADACHYAPLSA